MIVDGSIGGIARARGNAYDAPSGHCRDRSTSGRGFRGGDRWTCGGAVGRARLSGWPSVSPQKPVPKKVDHRKIAVSVAVVDEVQFLPAPEPGISPKARPLDVVLFIKKDVRRERRRTCDGQRHEEI